MAKTTQGDLLVDSIQTSAHGVDHGFRLLEDLLLHEVIELALHDLLQLQFNGLDGADIGGAIVLGQAVNVQLTLVDVSDIVVLEVQDFLCVLNDGRWVRGQEELSGLRDTVIRQEGSRLRAVEQGLVGRSKETGGRLLESDILGGLLRWKSTLFRELHINKVHFHLLRGSHTNDQGRTLAGRNDFVGVVN